MITHSLALTTELVAKLQVVAAAAGGTPVAAVMHISKGGCSTPPGAYGHRECGDCGCGVWRDPAADGMGQEVFNRGLMPGVICCCCFTAHTEAGRAVVRL